MENIMTIELSPRELYLAHIAEWRSEKEHTAYEHLVFLIKRNSLRKVVKDNSELLTELQGAFTPHNHYRYGTLSDLLSQIGYQSLELGAQAYELRDMLWARND